MPLPRTVAQALRHAKRTDSWEPGMCENFVASMYGAVGLGGYASASDQWNNIPSNLKHGDIDNAPKGALVFWGGGDGHVAISAGGGWVYTTDFSGDGTVSLVKASAITQGWGKPVSGWSQPYWGGHTVKMTGGAGDPPPEAKGKDGKDGPDMAQRENNQTNYGYAQEFLDSHPEIAQLVHQAKQHGWTDARLKYEIQDTDWYKEHTQAQRQYQLLLAESPEQAKQMVQDQAKQLRLLAGQSGVDLSDRELRNLAEKAARNNWDDVAMKFALAHHFDLAKRGDPMTGIAGNADRVIDGLSDQYGIKVDRGTRQKWISQTISGQIDPSTMEDVLREQAKTLYPSVAKMLDTRTLRDVLTPYMTAAADELGLSVDQMRTTGGKWTAALSGENGAMSMDEWMAKFRTDPKYAWDAGPAGRAAGSNAARSLLSALGGAL